MSGKLELFKKLGEYDTTTNETRLVNKSEFVGEYKVLEFTNGGDWCRRSIFTNKTNNYKFATASATGKVNIMWDTDDDEVAKINKYFKDNCTFDTKGTYIKYFKIFGTINYNDTTRAIRNDILEYYKNQKCVVCGTNTDLQCDHKNGLYNDPRVLSLETQTLEDFQSLCRHCNCQKRQVEKKTRETGIRYSATNIPSLSIYSIDFIEGDTTLDITNPNAMRGTYWYDPIAFHKHIHNTLTNANAITNASAITNTSDNLVLDTFLEKLII
jgi:hypothetical protein